MWLWVDTPPPLKDTREDAYLGIPPLARIRTKPKDGKMSNRGFPERVEQLMVYPHKPPGGHGSGEHPPVMPSGKGTSSFMYQDDNELDEKHHPVMVCSEEGRGLLQSHVGKSHIPDQRPSEVISKEGSSLKPHEYHESNQPPTVVDSDEGKSSLKSLEGHDFIEQPIVTSSLGRFSMRPLGYMHPNQQPPSINLVKGRFSMRQHANYEGGGREPLSLDLVSDRTKEKPSSTTNTVDIQNLPTPVHTTKSMVFREIVINSPQLRYSTPEERPLDRFRRVLSDLERSKPVCDASAESSLELWKRYYRSITDDDTDHTRQGRLRGYFRELDSIML